MGIEFTFFDYIDADGCGDNIIKSWLNHGGKPAKAFFTRMIGYLEASPLTGQEYSVWQSPYVTFLHGDWDGFIELRKEMQKIQYRLIGKVEGRNVFLVTWGFHKGTWETDVTPQTGKDRVVQMKNNAEKYRREHDNS
jgi:hypothetical protein